MQLLLEDILAQDSSYRRNFINSLPGPRSLHLIGTKGHRGNENIGVFNTIVHLQASPPMLGFILRPLTVPRETYHNLLANGHYTINTVQADFLAAAHQCSANYPVGQSEFAATGLTPYYSPSLLAPYVAEAPVKIGLSYVETHQISGGTQLVVGRIVEVIVPDEAISPEGHIDHAITQSTVVAGLDQYYQLHERQQLPYARVRSIK